MADRDRDEAAHAEVGAYLGDFSDRLVTTSAIVTEAMHFVVASKGGLSALAESLAVSDIVARDWRGFAVFRTR